MTGRNMKRLLSKIFAAHRIDLVKICVLALILIGPALVHASSDLIGSPAPGFELPDTRGAVFDLERVRGRVVFLNFWATWCVSCREELPELQTLFMKYGDAGFDVIGICVDGSVTTIERFMKEVSITFPILIDPDGKASDAYRVTGLPASFILDRDGVVRYWHMGFEKGYLPVYEGEIKELLKQQ